MARTREEIFSEIERTGVVAVVRAPTSDKLADIAQALLAGGVSAIEITMTTPKAIQGIAMLSDLFLERAIIGVGTVLDAPTAREAISAGAQFVVSPAFDPEIVATTRRYSRISIPGALTPTEILRAWTAGADVVKVFPSTTFGPEYFRDVLAPLPQLKLTPTGGVDLKNAGEWIRAGAAFIGVGSAMVTRDALAKGDWNDIRDRARAFVEAVRAARGG